VAPVVEVNANLMATPGPGSNAEEGARGPGFQSFKLGFRRFAVGVDPHTPRAERAQGVPEKARGNVHGPPHGREVFLFHPAVFKIDGEGTVGVGVFGQNQDAARVPVEAMNHPNGLSGGAGQLLPQARARCGAPARDDLLAGRFVHGPIILVFPQNP
jgi:hypothetical protein